MMSDGSAPSQPVVVELVCQGSVVRQEHATTGGTFGFQITMGQRNFDQIQPIDASVSTFGSGLDNNLGGMGTNDPFGSGLGANRADSINLSACELQGDLAGHQSEKIALGPRRVLDNPDVGVIVLHPNVVAEGGTVSLKTLAAPKKAKKAYEKALKELRKKKISHGKVAKELEKAVEIYPEFATAWQVLGEARIHLEDPEGAREAFGKALGADTQFASPRLSLAQMDLEAGQLETALELTEAALEINPQLAQAHFIRALAHTSLGRLDEAEVAALKVQDGSQAARFPGTHYVLGWIQARRGDFFSATQEYRAFLEMQPQAPIAVDLREQIATWESEGLIEAETAQSLE